VIVSRLNRVSSVTESSNAPYAVACPLLRRAELLALACVGGVQLPNHTLKALSHLPTLSEKHVIRRIDRVLRPTFCCISSSIPTSRRTDLQISCLSRRPAPAANAESNTGAHKLPLCRPSFHANPRAMHTLPGSNPFCEVDTLQDPVSTMRSPPPHIFHLEPGCTHTSLGLIYTCRATPCEKNLIWVPERCVLPVVGCGWRQQAPFFPTRDRRETPLRKAESNFRTSNVGQGSPWGRPHSSQLIGHEKPWSGRPSSQGQGHETQRAGAICIQHPRPISCRRTRTGWSPLLCRQVPSSGL